MNNLSFNPTRRKLAQAVALGVLALAANQAQAVNYSFSDLGTITGVYAGTNAVAKGINNLGQVAGYDGAKVFGLSSHNALVWNGNIATPLDNLPGGVKTLAWAINDAGQIAGFNDLNPVVDILNPIRWDGVVPTQLDTLGGGFMTVGSGINNNGQIVGGSWTGTGFHAVRWDGTAITDLGTLGGSESTALGINDAGQAVGFAATTGDAAYRAVRWDGNTITDLGTLGGGNSDAWAINNAGQIAGDSILADGETTHAVLWNGATLTDLAALGGTGTISFSEDINNLGQIAGLL